MARVRFAGIIAAAALAGSLAACSSTTSTPTAVSAAGGLTAQTAPVVPPTAPATTTSTTTTAVTDTPMTPTSVFSTSPPAARTVGALLTAFGPGDITVKHMPSADPSWIARVQTENEQYKVPQATDPSVLNLMALVDEAAREKDKSALARLCTKDCDAKQQAVLWAKPGVLDRLASLIEKAPMGEGTVLPDFLLFNQDDAFHNADDTAYGKLVGVTSPTAYFAAEDGVWTTFQNGTGGPDVMIQHWTGVKTGNR